VLETVKAHPNVELILRSNEMDTERARANALEFAALGVDVAIICHIDERTGQDIIKPLKDKLIPVIALEVPIPLATYFGIDNEQAGILTGSALGEWVKLNWAGQVDKVLVMTDYRFTTFIRTRMESAVSNFIAIIPSVSENVLYLQGSVYQDAYENSRPVLEQWGSQTRVAVIAPNDDATVGVLDVARELGYGNRIVGVGFGATLVEREFQDPESRFVASTEFYPHLYGKPLIELALEMARGERVKPRNFIQPAIRKRWSATSSGA
jgi:ribose transport system substrate-binding protein